MCSFRKMQECVTKKKREKQNKKLKRDGFHGGLNGKYSISENFSSDEVDKTHKMVRGCLCQSSMWHYGAGA